MKFLFISGGPGTKGLLYGEFKFPTSKVGKENCFMPSCPKCGVPKCMARQYPYQHPGEGLRRCLFLAARRRQLILVSGLTVAAMSGGLRWYPAVFARTPAVV